jgi:hypothetical protein
MALSTIKTASIANDAVTTDKIVNDGNLGVRNLIINGAMQVDQRNNGSSVNASDYIFGVDRFSLYSQTGLATKGDFQQNAGSVTPPTGFTNYLGFTSTSAYTIASGEGLAIQQRIEGYNLAQLGWGSSDAKSATVSFWVRSSLTGTFGCSIRNLAGNRSYPFTYTISSANTWEYKSVTIPGETTGTWLTTNGVGAYLLIGLGVGSTYSGTAGSWANANYIGATGATSVVATNGATFYLTGIQLELGSSATPFEHRSYGDELAKCQRYFQNNDNKRTMVSGDVTSGNNYFSTSKHITAMRAGPSVTFSSNAGNGFNTADPYPQQLGTESFEVYKTATATTAGGYYLFIYAADAEL